MSQTSDITNEIRTLIYDIRGLYRELPDTIAYIAGLHAISYTRATSPTADTRIIGGTAFVMHCPGYDGGVTSARDGNRDHAHDCLPTDPPSVLAVLTRIEDNWRHQLHHPAADTTSIDAAIGYLSANAPHAANTLDLTADLNDLAVLRGRLRTVTGHIDTPKPSDAPCITCNGRIVQRYTHKGLDDIRECNHCGKTYTPIQYALAVKNRMLEVRADLARLVTASEARTLWHLSEDQIYNWERGPDEDHPKRTPRIESALRDAKGRKLYLNADIAALRRTRVA